MVCLHAARAQSVWHGHVGVVVNSCLSRRSRQHVRRWYGDARGRLGRRSVQQTVADQLAPVPARRQGSRPAELHLRARPLPGRLRAVVGRRRLQDGADRERLDAGRQSRPGDETFCPADPSDHLQLALKLFSRVVF